MLQGAIALLATALLAGPAFAQESDDDVPGEVAIATNVEFVKFTVNGKAWENHAYTDHFKTLQIMGLDRLDTNTIVLSPRDESLKPLTLTLVESDFKRQRVRYKGRRVTVYRARRKVRFGAEQSVIVGAGRKAAGKAGKKRRKKARKKTGKGRKAKKGKKPGKPGKTGKTGKK